MCYPFQPPRQEQQIERFDLSHRARILLLTLRGLVGPVQNSSPAQRVNDLLDLVVEGEPAPVG